jgi:ABC-type lipoprotein export system ATPase subunit
MKKGKHTPRIAEMRAEYDFSGGQRGKYAKRFAEGTNIIILDPDVAELFPDSKTVNEALRALSKIADRQRKIAARTK